MVNSLWINNNSVIIAERGSRMKDLSDDQPKCLVGLRCKSKLEWQLIALRTTGISAIAIGAGYKQGLLMNHGLREFNNPRWAATNMVSSLTRPRLAALSGSHF